MEPGEAMRRAAELAARGRFRVEPNPPVGCVILRGGQVVGEGFHKAWGAPHAEIGALRQAGALAKGATVYVTLEPCGHSGKTPPCSDALIRAGVKEVVYAHPDPFKQTAGLGPNRLREAGIKVRRMRTPALVRDLLRPYLAHLQRRRPWVVAKWAMTLDGRTATRRGDSKWISCEKARKWAHRHFRARVDAIVVGAGTVRADDPALTNRSGRGPQPLRVVACGRRRLPRKAQVVKDDGDALLAIPMEYRPPDGIESIVCGSGGKVDPGRLLRYLFKRGVRRVLLEGGGDLAGSFFDRGYVDQVCVVTAPKVVGGIGAVAPIGGQGRAFMRDARRLEEVTHHTIGGDRILEAYVAR